MKLLVSQELHFYRDAGEQIFCDGPYVYEYWKRFLEDFEQITVIARVGNRSQGCEAARRADGPQVSFWALPDYLGPGEYVLNLRVLRKRIREAVHAADAYILQVPGLISRLAWSEIRILQRPYAAHVLGDPWDVFSPGGVGGWFRPFYRWLATRETKLICSGASAVAYYTRSTLQKRYPARPGAYSAQVTDVRLEGAIAGPEILQARADRLRKNLADGLPVRIGFVGSFAQMYKGPDTLLEAAKICAQQKLSLEILFAGDGVHRAAMENLAGQLGLQRHVKFVGMLPPGKPVFDFLDAVDLFVMPSRTEGLPRALIEAMARGCPCIASAVGGIPELLASEDLVPPNDSALLAQRISEVVRDPSRILRMSGRNLEVAKSYRPELMTEQRRAFYRAVREAALRNVTSDARQAETAAP